MSGPPSSDPSHTPSSAVTSPTGSRSRYAPYSSSPSGQSTPPTTLSQPDALRRSSRLSSKHSNARSESDMPPGDTLDLQVRQQQIPRCTADRPKRASTIRSEQQQCQCDSPGCWYQGTFSRPSGLKRHRNNFHETTYTHFRCSGCGGTGPRKDKLMERCRKARKHTENWQIESEVRLRPEPVFMSA